MKASTLMTRRIGIGVFAFFFIKGLVWLAVVAAAAVGLNAV